MTNIRFPCKIRKPVHRLLFVSNRSPDEKRSRLFEVWQQAFNIFVGVYMQEHPHEAPALIKYGQTIRDLAASGQNWRSSKNFRFLCCAQANRFPWGSIHSELWLHSQFPVKVQSTNHQSTGFSKSGGLPVPSGYCFKFHRSQFCAKRERTALVSVIFVPQRVNQMPILTVQPSLPTPVKLKPLVKFLSGYPPDLVQYIIYGFSKGFRLHFQGRQQFFILNNLPSALQNPKFVDKKLRQELAANRIAGPFTSPPFQSFSVSPIA